MTVNRIVLVGRDVALWLTVRALEGKGKQLSVVELPSALQPGEAIAASPSLGALHRRLGLDTDALLRAAGGLRIGGQYCRGWGPAPFLIGNEDPVVTAEGVDFGQYWAVERLAGATVPRDRLSPSAVAMAQGRVSTGKGLFAATPGFHLDAAAYAAALRSTVVSRAIPASSVEPVFADGRLVAVTLDDGTVLSGDFFVDASGAEATLIGRAPDDDWTRRDGIPKRALRWSSAPPLAPRPPFTDLARTSGGWQARFALADRTAMCEAGAEGQPFETGQRTPWRGNLIAIGDAACRVEPVDQLALHAAHVGIANLVAWFPASADPSAERATYNRSVGAQFRQMLDYQQCRHGEPDARKSPALARRLALFDAMGAVPAIDHDPFDPGQWARLFAGLGRVPGSASVQALALPTAQRQNLLAALVADLDRDALAQPTALEAR